MNLKFSGPFNEPQNPCHETLNLYHGYITTLCLKIKFCRHSRNSQRVNNVFKFLWKMFQSEHIPKYYFQQNLAGLCQFHGRGASLSFLNEDSICPTIFFIFPDRIAVLQPIDDIFPMFSQNDPTAVSKWKHDFSVMQSALFATIKRSQLPEEMINELTWSVTEGKNASMR